MPNISSKMYHVNRACAYCGVNLYGTPAGQWSYDTHSKGIHFHVKCRLEKLGQTSQPDPKPSPMTPQAPIAYNPPAPATPTVTQPSSACIERATKLVSEGRKIDAIKEIRNETNMGLTEAKNIVDRIAALLDAAKISASPKPQEQVQAQVSHTAKSLPPSPLEQVNYAPLHKQASNIIKRMRQGLYPFLHGAPGAGKTTLMQMIAAETKLDFLLIPCSPDMLRSEVLGTKNPLTGDYYASEFFNVWSNGGIILFDEVGNAPGAFLNLLNGALANLEMRFPNGARVSKHSHCYIVFADNSTLWGDDEKYPERQDAGGAFRNRLYYIRFDYDTELEKRVVAQICPGPVGQAWVHFVHEVRPIFERSELAIAASPRFAYAGAKVLAYETSLTRETMRELCNGALYEGLRESVVGALRSEVERVIARYAQN